tara:strand:- start:1332 stop:2960 length:1629 start_codon:yes stop_codon:yes gene_type:complete
MVNPTTAMPDAPMSGLANLMAMKGRDNDSMLVHLSPNEVNNLNKLSGNTMTINPATGLPEGRSRFLEAALPALLSIGAGIATGGMSIPAQMAAAAAAGYGGQRLVGKGHDEALTSAVIGGATAGLLGGAGAGSGALKDVAANTSKEALTKAAQEKAAQTLVSQGSDQTAKMIADQAIAAGNQGLQGSFSEVVSNLAPSGRDLYATIKASGLESLKNPSIYLPLAGRAATGTAGNALVDQMRADATRPRPIPMGMETEEIDIYSTPFTQTTMGPFNQQQIASNFISGGTAPYGFNYFNQAYGQEGGQVEEMNQGGLTQFQSIMGNPALQIQNPNPPLKMAEGGVATPQMGPRGSSQGGKGSGAFSEMLNNPEVLAMLGGSMSQTPKSYDVLASIGANPPQQMNHGGMTGAGTANSSIIPAIAPLIEVANQQAQQRLAKGGEIVEGLKEIATKKQPSMPAFEGRVKGQGDGMSDDIPFNIEGQQPALLARDEYVIPADVVAMVGNGSSDAGADKIDGAIANIRQEKYGRAQQPRETEGLGGLLG